MRELLINPFEKYSEKKLFGIGYAALAAGSFVAYLCGARFDGILDLHFVQKVYSFQPFIDNMINLFSLWLLLYIAGKIANKRTRAIDILATTAFARIPLYVFPLFNITGVISHIDPTDPMDLHFSTGEMTLILTFAVLYIGALVWYIALLYNGYKTATNCKTTARKAAFVIMVIIAEVLSKFLIYIIN